MTSFLYMFPFILWGHAPEPAYFMLIVFMLLLISIHSTFMYETPTYKQKEQKPSEHYVPHLDNMDQQLRAKIESMLKEIHPLIRLTDEKFFGRIVIEMPAYIEGTGMFAINHRKYRITFDEFSETNKKVRFELSNTSMNPKLLLCMTLITIALGWQKDIKDIKNII